LTHDRIYTSNFQRAFQSTCILREELYMLFSNVRTEFSGLLDPRKMGALEVRPLPPGRVSSSPSANPVRRPSVQRRT
jgi:hypothetical protein